MNKLIKLIMFIMVVFIIGCGTPKPTYNPNNKRIVFVDGNPYLIPYRTIYDKFPNKFYLNMYRSAGLNCNNNSVAWNSYAAFKTLDGAEAKYKKELGEKEGAKFYKTVMQTFAQYNEIGCSNKLSDREYKYYLNKEKQRTELYKAYMSSKATTSSRDTSRALTDTAYYSNSETSNKTSGIYNSSGTTQKIGNMYYHSDGSSTQKIGNMYHNSDGSSTQKIGNFYHNSDGSSTQKIGNFYHNSDGSSTQKIGNIYYHSDGTSTQQIGNSYYSN